MNLNTESSILVPTSIFVGSVALAGVFIGAVFAIVYMLTNRGTYMEVVRDSEGRIVQIIERNYINPGGLILNTSQSSIPTIVPVSSQSSSREAYHVLTT